MIGPMDSMSHPPRRRRAVAHRMLTGCMYAGFAVAALAVAALLVVFPTLGTPGGEYTLYALRRPVPVTAGEFRLAVGLFLAAGGGSAVGIVAALSRPGR